MEYEEDWSDWVDISLLDRPEAEPETPEPDSTPEPDQASIQPAQPPGQSRASEQTKIWYLGIDIGTTGISAVLFNGLSQQVYPVYWQEQQTAPANMSDRRFRLPAIASFAPISIHAASSDAPQRLIHDFKPFLKLGIPCDPTQTGKWQPVLQWSNDWQIPLRWLQETLQQCLSRFHSSMPQCCSALGLEPADFQAALKQLSGIVVGIPANWPDTYSFNVREAILSAELIDQPDRIFFLDDAIAAALSVLQLTGQADRQANHKGINLSASPQILNADWQGPTLILNAGATVTELALVDLPSSLQDLTHADFQIRSLDYAGNNLDQDIVCQLFYPLLQQSATVRDLGRIDLSLDAVSLEQVGLNHLPLPTPGDPDRSTRYRLQQQLESSQSGQTLLEAARALKIAFQQQSRFTLKLGDRQWTIRRQDLGTRVLLPYVQRLNRELNALLQQTQTAPLAVNQAICTGGSASMGAIARWLRQKLPSATIVQDTYARPAYPNDNCISSCSRVAYGLAVLPLYPQILDLPRQQFNDHFLLRELLRVFPTEPVTEAAMMQRLQQRGIDVESCRSHILALLAGHLPPGLIPATDEAALFTRESFNHPTFQAIRSQSLFQSQDHYYIPNSLQHSQLQNYLDMLLSNSYQQLNSPYISRPSMPQYY
ncbi:MAG: hypothetical protein Kow00121_50800 [Elainellaceae cyanobacterium]